jgi:hypothetical protein
MQPGRSEAKSLQPVCEPLLVYPLLFGGYKLHNAVEAIKHEHSSKTSLVDRPRPRVNASLKQPGKMIDDDIVDKSFPRGMRRTVKENVVQPN